MSQLRVFVDDESFDDMEANNPFVRRAVTEWLTSRAGAMLEQAYIGDNALTPTVANTATEAASTRDLRISDLINQQWPIVDREIERTQAGPIGRAIRWDRFRHELFRHDIYGRPVFRDLDTGVTLDRDNIYKPKPPTTAKIGIECPLDFIPGKVEPDWSRFEYLELLGCRIDDGKAEVVTGLDKDQSKFFSVYGTLKEGGIEPILDIKDVTDDVDPYATACHRASQLAKMSFLPLYILV